MATSREATLVFLTVTHDNFVGAANYEFVVAAATAQPSIAVAGRLAVKSNGFRI
jgi:hypothetical protein